MVKKGLSILALVAIIFSGTTLYPLMARSLGECRRHCCDVCRCCEPQEIPYEPIYPLKKPSCSSSCTCLTKCPPTTPCCLALSYAPFGKSQVGKIAILPPNINLVLPTIYHPLEYPLIFIKLRLYISSIQNRAPPLCLPA